MKNKSFFLFFLFCFSRGHLFALTELFDQALAEISSLDPNFSLPELFKIELTQFLFGEENFHLSCPSNHPKEGLLADWAIGIFLKNYIKNHPDHSEILTTLFNNHRLLIDNQMIGLSLQKTGSGYPIKVMDGLLFNATKAFYDPSVFYRFLQGKTAFFRVLPENLVSWSGINQTHVVAEDECRSWYLDDIFPYCLAFFQLKAAKKYVKSLKGKQWEEKGLSISYWNLYSFFALCVLALHKQQTYLFPITLDQTSTFQEIDNRFQVIQQKLSESSDLSWNLVASIFKIYQEDDYTFPCQRDSDLFLFPFLPVVYFFYRNLLGTIKNYNNNKSKQNNYKPKFAIYSHWPKRDSPQANLQEYFAIVSKNDFQVPPDDALPSFFREKQNPFLQIYVALRSVLRSEAPLNQNHDEFPLAREFLFTLFQYSYPVYSGDRTFDFSEIQRGRKSSWNQKISCGVDILFKHHQDLARALNQLLSTLRQNSSKS